MALPTVSFLLGSLAFAYLLTFVFFAIVRIFTGLSIQRLGFTSLRHITYAPRDGLRLEIRGLGLRIHRPSFAQPTWLSLVIEELKVTLDLTALSSEQHREADGEPNGKANGRPKLQSKLSSAWNASKKTDLGKSKLWAKLTEIKNGLKKLHRIIAWLRLIDVVAHRSTCIVEDVGTLQIGTVIVSVDTRTATVDRSKLFQHNRTHVGKQTPAEWHFGLRSILFTPKDKDAIEILDHLILNIHGYLRPKVEGLRDASVSLKIGRLHIPYDDFHSSSLLAKDGMRSSDAVRRSSASHDSSPFDEREEDENRLPQVLFDAKDFVSSTLGGIREVTVALGFLGVSKKIHSVHPAGNPLYLNASMKEVGMDLYRLDPTTPAHSMYFSRKEVAHQALITAISVSVGIDVGHDHPERLLYVPMTTATIRTTLPAKLLQASSQEGLLDLNSNVLFANLVVTSPSVDLDPAHLPLVLAAVRGRPKSTHGSKSARSKLSSRLLPKAMIKLSIHEPVVRVSLPPVETRKSGDFDFDLLISAVSSVSLDIESSHNTASDVRYNASMSLRIASHRLYYQTTSRDTHDLLISDAIELKAQITSNPDLQIVIAGNFETLSVFMVRPEIGEGLRQIVHQLRSDVKSKKLRSPKTARDPHFIRTLPPWLHHVGLQASDLNIEVAGVDHRLSSLSRGFALHLDSWSAEYKLHKDDVPRKPAHRRRGGSHSKRSESESPTSPPPKGGPKIAADISDGRRVAVHIKGFEGFIIESSSAWESEPCISIPRGEVALTTSHDGQGPVLHVNSHVRAVHAQYSLFRHYAIGVGIITLRKILSRSSSEMVGRQPHPDVPSTDSEVSEASKSLQEYVSVDVRVSYVQVKAQLPDDPNTMLHLIGVDAGRHRWHTPFIRASVARLFAQTPAVKHAWSRIVSFKTPRVDLRQIRRKQGSSMKVERSVDVVAEAIRIGVPHQLVVHKLFDNFINTAKTAAQLHHRFQTDSDEYILQKHPEGPKNVPKITLRTRVFLFEIEDGPFEWKLGTIFRTGLIEQNQRIAREEAFRVKCKKIRSSSTKLGTSHMRSRSHDSTDRGRGHSHGRSGRDTSTRARRRSFSQSGGKGKSMRYDKDGTHGMSGFAQTNIDDAWKKLQRFNSESWKKRIDDAMRFQQNAIQDIRELIWGAEDSADVEDSKEVIVAMTHRPALAAVLMSDLTMTIDKPSFPMDQLPDFLHRVGKGMPKDTQFSLLIPLNAQFDVGEMRISLRDYPLPLMHFPAIKPGQSPRLPSWSLKTDFVIAEEYRDFESTRDLQIMVIPPEKLREGDKNSGGFAVDVRRTVSPVKTYSDIKIDIHTARDTKITWGTSYQPAIQDTMQVIEGFSKPQIDPSDKVGFWDKIRLSFHSRINIAWTGGGDVHLMLKGSRDPYVVTGHGTGFIMIWRNNVRWSIGQADDPCKFMTVDSGDYVLAIPDFSNYARRSADMMTSHGIRSIERHADDKQTFKKVIMKLSGKVRWLAGLVFERNLEGGGRSFDFEPHHKVTLKNPVHVKHLLENDSYDAFKGFRSNHIHMSIAVIAPSDREWSVTNLEPASNYNSVHLSPRFFTHFFAWWELFSGVMSLPIRQGRLFPGVDKSGKKFGRHLATVKYSLLLSPLFLSHMYVHKDGDEFAEDVVSGTGLKVRLDSFIFDVHQRREEFCSEVKGLNKQVVTTGMRVNEALLDLIKADMRAVSVRLSGTSLHAIKHATPEELHNMGRQQGRPAAELSNFDIPDNDFSWVDVDDMVEVDWTLPHHHNPKTAILPLAFAPRFTYRRQTDHGNTISGDAQRHSPFGNEQTHYCVMSSSNDSRRVQVDLIKNRLNQVDELIVDHGRALGEQELHVVREIGNEEETKAHLKELQEHSVLFERKKEFLSAMVRNLQHRIDGDEDRAGASIDEYDTSKTHRDEDNSSDSRDDHDSGDDPKSSLLAEHVSDFNNRFIVHNAQIKWNNSLRNTMLRYIHQVSQRRGFVYYTSRRAVKFILDIIEEQHKASKQQSNPSGDNSRGNSSPQSAVDDGDGDEGVQDRIQQLLEDGKRFVNADDSEAADGRKRKSSITQNANDDVSHDFVAQNTYHVRLVAPQIQLQSEKNPKAVVLMAARGMRLQVFQIMDKDRMSDEVSGLVQTRYTLDMDNMQVFVTSKQMLSSKFLQIYSTNSYGTATGTQWPPWAPMEAMFDFGARTYGFARVVQRNSACLRYDKYNKLRLKYNDNVSDGKGQTKRTEQSAETRMDQLWVDFPQLRAICDSGEYYAIYIIVLDLLMWSEPLEKTRNERLEKIMLASDFSDLRGAPEMVIMLQERIRALREIKTHFHINEKYLDRQGWQDRIAMEQDLASCEDELFFMMKAITTSQRRYDERSETSQANGILRYHLAASEIVWHLLKEADHPLAEFQLRHAVFERTDNSDGSNHNCVDIDQIKCLSLLPNAIYPETISAYTDHLSAANKNSDSRMIHIKWYKLEAIAGINVVDHFEVNLHPLKVQLEYDTGRKLFEYVFPGAGSGEEGFSPFLVRNSLPQTEEEEEEDPEAAEAHRNSIVQATKDHPLGSATGAGSLEHRLQPTHALPDYNRTGSSGQGKDEGLGVNVPTSSLIRLLHHDGNSKSRTSLASSMMTVSHRASNDSLSTTNRGRDLPQTPQTATDHAHRRRFGGPKKHRDSSTDSRKQKAAAKDSDDLTQMLNRASNYMTLAYVKIPSVVLCLSYKGKGARNFEDVHNLVFRMPTLEYRNKTWSNLDLALALKKDIIRALISHTGAIIGNKFSHHKYGKMQQSRLRELASSSALLSSTEVSRVASSNTSLRNLAMPDDPSPRRSDVSDYTADLMHTESFASGLSDYGTSQNTPSTQGEEEVEQIADTENEPEPNGRRHAFTRHFSELTQKAIRRTTTGLSGEDSSGHQAGADNKSEVHDGDETTPRRAKLVKKLLHSLDR